MIAIKNLELELVGDLYCVTAHAEDEEGRTNIDLGIVNLKGLAEPDIAPAMMQAVTEAKRRAIASLLGEGYCDGNGKVMVNVETGEIIEPPVTEEPPKERKSTATRVQEHMQATGQTGPLNPEPPREKPDSERARARWFAVCNEHGFPDSDIYNRWLLGVLITAHFREKDKNAKAIPVTTRTKLPADWFDIASDYIPKYLKHLAKIGKKPGEEYESDNS